MHDIGILLTFAGGLAVALVLGFVAHRLKLSPIVGYLVAGVLVGPFTPGFVADRAVAEQFAEIGVILLLFGIGLRFHLRELIAVWRVAVPGALMQSTASTLLLAALLTFFGWSWTSGIILGMGISVASTVVMALVLAERHDLHAPIGHIAIGWTVVEDLLTVALLLLLPILFGQNHDQGAGVALGLAGLKVVGLVAVVVVLGKWVIPFALERIEKTRQRELFTLAVLVLAVGIAVGSAEIFGVSMALGAFLAGLAVGRSEFASRAAGDAVPMRDAFAVLFFVSVGMLFDPLSILQVPHLILTVLVVVVVGKPLAALWTMRLLGVPMATAAPVGAAFSQVGEFSFILGTVARQLGLLSDAGWNALVASSIISISLNPTIYRWTRKVTSAAPNTTPPSEKERPAIDPNRCILVGYGPVGRIVYSLLTDRGVTVTVIDLNLDTVRKMKADGIAAIYGDVLRSGTLEEAGIHTAGSLILSADVEDAAEIVRQARILNPDLRVLARCTHLRAAPALKRAGAAVVAVGEAEVGVALSEAVMANDEVDITTAAARREAVRAKLYESDSATERVSGNR
ncbi:MAG: cation:proton antiporter [Myxococcales bacterium]|nr:cation:proton antiporter [Myxococcales bacterium]